MLNKYLLYSLFLFLTACNNSLIVTKDELNLIEKRCETESSKVVTVQFKILDGFVYHDVLCANSKTYRVTREK